MSRASQHKSANVHKMSSMLPGADPGCPIGGDANPPGGHSHMILPSFVKNCMKLRKFRPGACPPKSATDHGMHSHWLFVVTF